MNETAPSPKAARQPLPRPRRPRRWLTVLLGVVIFVCGAVIGSAATLLIVRDRVLHMLRHPDEAPARITARLRRKLRLSDEQAEQVEAILARRQAALQEIRCKVQPTVERHLDAARDEIAAVLTPEQAETWHAHFTRLRDTWVPPLPPQDP